MTETLTTIEKALFFKELPFFAHVPIEAMATVAANAEEAHYEPGAVIMAQGQPAEYVFITLEGHVVVEKDGIVITVLDPGQGFGDLSLTPDATNAIHVRAVEHVHLLRFSLAGFTDTLLDHPEVAVGVIRAVSLRMRELSDQITELRRQMQDGSQAMRIPEGI